MPESRPNRQNIYLPDHLRDAVSGYPSLSGRVSTVLDRYHEALRRTRIADRFTSHELDTIYDACVFWSAEPAATVFGGVELELIDMGGVSAELMTKVQALTPFEQVALVEWIETQRRRGGVG